MCGLSGKLTYRSSIIFAYWRFEQVRNSIQTVSCRHWSLPHRLSLVYAIKFIHSFIHPFIHSFIYSSVMTLTGWKACVRIWKFERALSYDRNSHSGPSLEVCGVEQMTICGAPLFYLQLWPRIGLAIIRLRWQGLLSVILLTEYIPKFAVKIKIGAVDWKL